MTTVKGPAKDSVTALELSPDGGRRFMIGLYWTPQPKAKEEPEQEAPELKEGPAPSPLGTVIGKLLSFGKKGGAPAASGGRDREADRFDLDLDCYIFNENWLCKCVIGTEGDALLVEGSKKVYHSGDDRSGASGEQVYVETEGLPEDYTHIFFVVRSDCKYSLDQFSDPVIRLVDPKTEEVILENSLIPGEDLPFPKAYNYAFCHIYREGGAWRFRNLDFHMGDGVEWDLTLPDVAKRAA